MTDFEIELLYENANTFRFYYPHRTVKVLNAICMRKEDNFIHKTEIAIQIEKTNALECFKRDLRLNLSANYTKIHHLILISTHPVKMPVFSKSPSEVKTGEAVDIYVCSEEIKNLYIAKRIVE